MGKSLLPGAGNGVISRLYRFLCQGVYEIDLHAQPRLRAWLLGTVRVVVHVSASFSQKLAGLQAAGLTMLTVLALVPMLALVSALAKVLGYAEKLDATLVSWQERLPKEVSPAFEWIRERIAEVNFGALGLVGLVVVLWSGFALFIRVEQALNLVWRTTHSRPWHRRISDFLALVVVVPPMAVLSLAASSLLSGLRMSGWLRDQATLSWLYGAGLGFVPHVLAWVTFTLLYKIMPSARVQWRAALVGGVLAGSTLVLLHGLYLSLNIGVANANAFYITFSALPILLIYVQLLWTIVLAGAEIGYAVQNLGALHGGETVPAPSFRVRQRLAWHLVQQAGTAFRGGQKGTRTSALCMRLDVPAGWLDEVAENLVDGGVLVALLDDEDLLMPARPPEQIAMADVAAAVAGADDAFLQRVRLPAAKEAQLLAAESAARAQLTTIAF